MLVRKTYVPVTVNTAAEPAAPTLFRTSILLFLVINVKKVHQFANGGLYINVCVNKSAPGVLNVVLLPSKEAKCYYNNL